MIQEYFRKLWTIHTRPAEFFRNLPLEGGTGGPLAFALVTHWLGKSIGYLWTLAIGEAASVWLQRVADLMNRTGAGRNTDAEVEIMRRSSEWIWSAPWERMSKWFWSAGAVITDPFFTLVSILFTSFFIWVGARIFVTPSHTEGAPRQITWESTVRLVCYGMSPMILASIPFVGWGLASLITLIVTVVGAREVYKIQTGRAIAVVLFPKFLLVGMLLAGFFFFAFLMMSFISRFFQ